MPFNQAFRDGCPGAVKIGGAMAGFTDHNHASIGVTIEHFAEVL
jgi:hypothetical protein